VDHIRQDPQAYGAPEVASDVDYGVGRPGITLTEGLPLDQLPLAGC
jgi:hypothetical protein